MTNERNIFKVPKNFNHHKGRSSTDMPQELYREKDFKMIEVFLRNGEVKRKVVCRVNWTASFLPEDIIAWRIP